LEIHLFRRFQNIPHRLEAKIQHLWVFIPARVRGVEDVRYLLFPAKVREGPGIRDIQFMALTLDREERKITGSWHDI
jgi:hypothetical protein